MILKSFLCFNEPNLIIGMEHHHDVYPRCFRETIEIIACSFGSGDSRSREEKKEFILYIYIYIIVKIQREHRRLGNKIRVPSLETFFVDFVCNRRSYRRSIDKADRNDPLCIIYTYTRTPRLTK